MATVVARRGIHVMNRLTALSPLCYVTRIVIPLPSYNYSTSSTVFALDPISVIVDNVKGNTGSANVSMNENETTKEQDETKIKTAACGDINDDYDDDDDDDDEMEQEEMFVDAYDKFEYKEIREWGGPRRGGRLPEPTRYGDWERKGRCSDF
jgi:hypothetical protein